MAFQAHVENLLSKCQYHPSTQSYLAQEIPYVTSRYPSLQVQVTDLMFNNQPRAFLCFNGTIPVPYKGSIYNIPVRIIYPDPYPSVAPIVRVIPTANMFVKSSEYVEEDGTVKLNILYSWNYTYNTVFII
jgi:ESCRT-I complex subunit TSG101